MSSVSLHLNSSNNFFIFMNGAWTQIDLHLIIWKMHLDIYFATINASYYLTFKHISWFSPLCVQAYCMCAQFTDKESVWDAPAQRMKRPAVRPAVLDFILSNTPVFLFQCHKAYWILNTTKNTQREAELKEKKKKRNKNTTGYTHLCFCQAVMILSCFFFSAFFIEHQW